MRNMATTTPLDAPSIGPRKTFLIMVTVVGCIAILWPKVFYPMMFGGVQKQNVIKEHRGTGLQHSCCDVVLDRDTFMNISVAIGDKQYRKKLILSTGELSLRQERPPHLRADTIHPAMRERGRAIPAAHTVPMIERARPPADPPIIRDGRPGPVPGMRPPMGAGSVHQAQPKGSNMGFIMPLYTIGIIAFFVYTILKILFKKPLANAPYGPARNDPTFRKEVFGGDSASCKTKRPDDGGTKLGLIDAADEQLKRQQATSLSKETPETSSSQNLSNGHAKTVSNSNPDVIVESPQNVDEPIIERAEAKKSEAGTERTVQVLGMEMTASCEGGKSWGRPPTPVFSHRSDHSADDGEVELTESPAIYLERPLARDSQILIADSETKTETVVDEELNGTPEEPAVVLSSKMTLSLINLNTGEDSQEKKESSPESESPAEELEEDEEPEEVEQEEIDQEEEEEEDLEHINGDEDQKKEETNSDE